MKCKNLQEYSFMNNNENDIILLYDQPSLQFILPTMRISIMCQSRSSSINRCSNWSDYIHPGLVTNCSRNGNSRSRSKNRCCSIRCHIWSNHIRSILMTNSSRNKIAGFWGCQSNHQQQSEHHQLEHIFRVGLCYCG